MYAVSKWGEPASSGKSRTGLSVQAPPRGDEHDRRLGEAIDGYLAQLQQGRPVSLGVWARRFPDVADELRECLDALPLVPRTSQRRSGAHGAARRTGQSAGRSHPVPPESLAEATVLPTLPGYTLFEEIGRGGMGVVYRARQHATKRLVALKFLASGCYASLTARRRFAREIELAAALDHPGIVRVLEAGESAAGVYCAMELVDGDPLHVYLARHELGVPEKLQLFLRIVEAVQYAHLRAVIHRDLKPSNIMVDKQGRPRILDFGLARSVPERDARDQGATFTQDGQLVGTLPYFSPEQAAGTTDEVDMRSDLYALGVVLYGMLTGRLPYETTGSLAAALHNICHVIPPRPSQFCRGLKADIDAVVLRALEKSKEDRYQTSAELAEDVRCCLRGEPARANRSSRFYLVRKAYARHRMQVRLAAAGLSLVVAASALILALYVQVQQERDRLEEQLHVSVLRRGLAHLAAGHDMLAEDLLWPAYLERPDARAHWSLLSYYAQNPLVARMSGCGWTTCLACSPDHRFIAYGNLAGTLGIRDARTFEDIWSLKAHPGGVSCVAFSPDAQFLAAAGTDGRISLWSVGTWQLLGEFEAHRGGVTQLCFAKGGNQLVSAGNDGTLLLWAPCGSGRARTIFADEGRRPIAACDLSSGGELLAVATPDDPLRIVDIRNGAVRAVLDQLGGAVEAVRFSPDARRLAVWSNAEISLWDLDSGTRSWTRDAGLAEPRPTSLWNISPKPHASWRPALEFSHDGALLASAGWDAVVRMWRPDNGDKLGELRAHGTAVYAIAFQDDPHRLVAAYVGRIAVWDLDRHPGMLSRKVSPGLERTCVAVSGKARLMAWGDAADGSQGVVSVMNIVPPYDVATWPAHAAPLEALAFGPDGRRLATADRDGNVAVWDVASHEKLHGWRAGDTRVRALAFSPDGTRIATGNLAGELQIRDSTDGFLEQSWIAHRGLILAIAFSPDGKRLASAGTDWRARLWELGRHSLVNEWCHDEWVNAVAFSPSGRCFATGSADLAIRTGRPEAQPAVEIRTAHAHWVNAVAFLDQGRVLVSAGNDAAIRFWDARSGRELAAWPSQWGPVHSLALTPDERFLAIGAAGAVRLVDLGAAAELIRQETPRRR